MSGREREIDGREGSKEGMGIENEKLRDGIPGSCGSLGMSGNDRLMEGRAMSMEGIGIEIENAREGIESFGRSGIPGIDIEGKLHTDSY